MNNNTPTSTFLENQKALHVELEKYKNSQTKTMPYLEYMKQSTAWLKEKQK